jgi:phage-related protein
MKIQFFDESIEQFILSLEKPTIARTIRTIDLLEEFGYKLGMPHSKKVEKNLFELRISSAQEVRIFYTFHKNLVILLYGFVKKSQKIPKKELLVALRRLKVLTNL